MEFYPPGASEFDVTAKSGAEATAEAASGGGLPPGATTT